MSEVLSGARYTFGALVVLTVWSIGMVQFAEWKLDNGPDISAAEKAADDDALRRFGPGANASDATVERFMEMVIAEKLKE